MAVVIAIAAIAAIAVVGWVAVVVGRRKSAQPQVPATPVASTRPRPEVAEFHVSGDTATVEFAVPIPPGGADPVLADLLTGEAVEVVREKRHELPIDQVELISVWGRSDGGRTLVGEVKLGSPGTLPPPAIPELVPHASKLGFDPLGNFDSSPVQTPPTLAADAPVETLGPIGGDVRLIASAEAGLRAQASIPPRWARATWYSACSASSAIR